MRSTLFIAFLAAVFTTNAQEIAGKYYVGEPNYDASLEHPWKRTFESVDIKFDESKTTIELTYDSNERPMQGHPSSTLLQAVKNGDLVNFEMSTVGPRCLTTATLLQIEPGVFVVEPATRMDLGCTTIERAQKSNAPAKGGKVYPVESLVREFILGKDKERIDELVANKAEYEKLVEQAVRARCEAVNNASAKPLPDAGKLDASENEDVNTIIRKWAIQKRWPQAVNSAFAISNDWEIVRGSKGQILRRTMQCVVIMDQNGSCSWKQFVVHQDYDGSKYGQSYVFGEHPGQYKTDCK